MVNVIVSADDFGLSDGVNRGILEAAAAGLLSSTSLMVNFPELDRAASLLHSVPHPLEIGIHLNLTCGGPVLAPGDVSSLVRKSGRFFELAPFVARVCAGRLDWEDARREWKAQVEAAVSRGFELNWISSHQHVHMLPPLAEICADLCREYEIPFVRLTRFIPDSGLRRLRSKRLFLLPLVPAARRHFQTHSVMHNDRVFELDIRPPPPGAARRLLDTLHDLAGGTYELITHPGYVDQDLIRRDPYTDGRLRELECLCSSELSGVLRSGAFSLTTFGEISEMSMARGPG